MDDAVAGGWRVFDAAMPVLIYEYSFGPGRANALAVGGTGGLVVFSPPCRARAEVFDALERFGPVVALVAPNAYHTLGLAQWKARHPGAAVFAPMQSIERVQRRTNVTGIRPLSEGGAIFGPHLVVTDMPHYKTGEALVRVSTGRGRAWYVTDVIFNMHELPPHPVVRLVFRLARSAPGLRFNNLAALFMMQDKRAVRRWIADEFRKAPPDWLIPAHGVVADFKSDPALAQALLSAA